MPRRVGTVMVILAAVIAPRSATGQSAAVGDRVRLRTATEELQGELSATVPDSLLVRPEGYRVVRAVCLCDLVSLEVSRGRSLAWLPLGIAGAALGAVAAGPLVDSGLLDDPGYLLTGLALTAAFILLPLYPFVDEANVTPMVGAVVGGAIGVGIGLYAAPDRWQAVTGAVPAVPATSGRRSLGVRFRLDGGA